MELEKGKLVVFDDFGKVRKVDRLGVRWDDKKQAWWVFAYDDAEDDYRLDEDYNKIRIYSTTVIDKPKRQKKAFVPSRETCTVQISPCGSTEKAYQIEDGWNGKWGKGRKEWYKYIAKSVCWIDEEGRIFAPVWAVR